MTLLEGSRRVARNRQQQQKMLRKASDSARKIFSDVGEAGISERDLIAAVIKQNADVDPELVIAAVDALRGQGITRKDWKSGLLTSATAS